MFTKQIWFLALLCMLSLNSSIVYSAQTYSATDYMYFQPGHYNQYTVNDNSLNNCVVEIVFQDAVLNTYSISLTQIGTIGGHWANSHFRAENVDGTIFANGGVPVGNQGNYFRIIYDLPPTFVSGQKWTNYNKEVELTARYLGDSTIGGTTYNNCIKISFNSTSPSLSYLKGTGEAILAPAVGILSFTFNKADGDNFTAVLIESGILSPVKISGTYILDGNVPAQNYLVSISNDVRNVGKTGGIVDKLGHFNFTLRGHSIVLRYGPLNGPDSFNWDYHNEKKIDNISTDLTINLTGPDVGLAISPELMPPSLIIWPGSVTVDKPYIVINGESQDVDGVEKVLVNNQTTAAYSHDSYMFWNKRVDLSEGYNVIKIQAFDKNINHNNVTKEIVVNYQTQGYKGPSIEAVPLTILPYNRQEITYILNPNGLRTEAYLNYANTEWEDAPFNSGRSLGYEYSGTDPLILTYNFPETDRSLQLGEKITFRIHSQNNQGFAETQIVSFIVGAPDNISPIIETTSPQTNEKGVPLNPKMKIQFNEQLDIHTINLDSFTLNGQKIDGVFKYDMSNYTATITLNKPLEIATEYSLKILSTIKDYAGNNFIEKEIKFTTNTPTIDQAYSHPSRVNVGDSSTISYHLEWSNYTAISDGVLTINGKSYTTNSTGWISFIDTNTVMTKTEYKITQFDYKGITKCVILVDNPTCSWDAVEIAFENGKRVDLGNPKITWMGQYRTDSEPFTGTLNYNDTIIKLNVGKYTYQVTSINDPKWGITQFTAKPFTVIYDRVSIKFNGPLGHINAGTTPTITPVGYYEYDSTPFTGQIVVNTPSSTQPGKFTYSVDKIVDSTYGLTGFKQNEYEVIWDRVKVTKCGASTTSTDAGKTITYWCQAIYEYDGKEFTGASGALSVDGSSMKYVQERNRWEVDLTSTEPKQSQIKVNGVTDNTYGLTALNTDDVQSTTIEWKSSSIPGYPIEATILGVGISIIFLLFKLRKLRDRSAWDFF